MCKDMLVSCGCFEPFPKGKPSMGGPLLLFFFSFKLLEVGDSGSLTLNKESAIEPHPNLVLLYFVLF